MKTTSYNRLGGFVRALCAVTLMSAASAMALVALRPYGPLMVGKSATPAKLRLDPDADRANQQAMPGPERDGGPTAYAEEQYAQRAFPAAYVPFQLTANAQKGWTTILAATGNKSTAGAWSLVGPSVARFPSVLTFSGAPYTTSGRITALAISPDCTRSSCRVWAAAAGGGLWRTDNGLSNSPTWSFISDSSRRMRSGF